MSPLRTACSAVAIFAALWIGWWVALEFIRGAL